MIEEWQSCAHSWEPKTDSQYDSPYTEDVVCKKCGCPGERNIVSGLVYWPTT